jgi:hypothetical protein
MKTKWYKPLITLLALMICMSVIYLPALADEPDLETETPYENDEQDVVEDTEDVEEVNEPVIVINIETG